MQKKDYTSQDNSSSKLSQMTEDKKALFKKIAIWGTIIAVSVASLAVLVVLAGRGGTPEAPVVVENLRSVDNTDIVTGNPEGEAVLIKYADFQCSACASYNPMLKTLANEYKDNLMIVYRHFPLNNIHDHARISGQTAYAAWKLGNFEDMKDLLYENQGVWENVDDPKPIFIGYAKDIGLDASEFETLMNSDEAKKAVDDGEKEALGMGLNSTPTFFLGNQRISPRNIDDFRILINAEVEK